MTPTTRLLVVDVSLASSERDYDEDVTFLGRDFRIVRQGTDGDTDLAASLVDAWSEEAAAIAVTGAREARAAQLYDGDLEAVERLVAATTSVPVTDGRALRDVLQEWAVRHVQAELPGFFTNARTVLLGAAGHDRITRILSEHTQNLAFEDPLLRWDVPARLDALPALAKPAVTASARAALWPARHLPDGLRSRITTPGQRLSTALTRRAATDADVVVGAYDEIAAFGFGDLTGKTVITSAVSEERLKALGDRGVDMVLDTTPQPFHVTVVAAMLDAMMLALTPRGRHLTDDDLLEMLVASGMQPRVLYPNGFRRRSRFAFVIHPLSQKFFTHVEPLATVARVMPAPVMNLVEKGVAYLPPFPYSHVTGIKSPTGAEAEGWLISVGGTPKQLMSHSPEFTYDQLLQAADIARSKGAQIMGLGAFTKVVGDAGVTVARRAPLPVTTGNSYSASGALWAAHEAMLRLGIAEVDDDGRISASAMVVGGTGAIGSVCARLLALSCDDLWLVSPETAKLLALKHDIERSPHRARIHIAATPNGHLADMDLIVTATSGAGKRVLDIMAVKPGCVITDVARPLDLSAEDVALRPDVLVIESGEIQLPGDVRMKSIGLPANVAYACLAETIVLALEGRFESFTVGREIEWEKVKEIYRLGLKHGMRLAVISGVNGPYSDEDFGRIRRLALERRAETAAQAV